MVVADNDDEVAAWADDLSTRKRLFKSTDCAVWISGADGTQDRLEITRCDGILRWTLVYSINSMVASAMKTKLRWMLLVVVTGNMKAIDMTPSAFGIFPYPMLIFEEGDVSNRVRPSHGILSLQVVWS